MGCGGSKGTQTSEGANQASPRRDNKTVNDKSDIKTSNNNNNRDAKDKNSPRKSGRETKYYTQSQSNSVNGDVHKEATDKGYKRRLRQQLIEATSKNDIEALEKAIKKFEQNRLEDCGDLTKANEKLAFLKMKKDLRDAIRRNHAGVLERTISEAKSSPYADQLGSQIEAAERKLAHLKELNEHSHDILAMGQQTISEIHSYHRPPACVHDVMAATYMLFGHDESTLRDWSYLQSMIGRVGKDSLIHRVRDFDSDDVDNHTADRVKEILNYHDLGEVRLASNGAATFHVWAGNIVDKISKDSTEEEERARRENESHHPQDEKKGKETQGDKNRKASLMRDDKKGRASRGEGKGR